MGSGSSANCKRDVEFCPICGSVLIRVQYRGNESRVLALVKRDGFRGFWGCLRADLHDKVLDGVDYRGKVFIKPIFKDDVQLAV